MKNMLQLQTEKLTPLYKNFNQGCIIQLLITHGQHVTTVDCASKSTPHLLHLKLLGDTISFLLPGV